MANVSCGIDTRVVCIRGLRPPPRFPRRFINVAKKAETDLPVDLSSTSKWAREKKCVFGKYDIFAYRVVASTISVGPPGARVTARRLRYNNAEGGINIHIKSRRGRRERRCHRRRRRRCRNARARAVIIASPAYH